MVKPKRRVIGRITRPCEACGTPINRKASQFREHAFCSTGCYWSSPYHSETVGRANSSRNPEPTFVTKACEGCGVAVTRQRSQFRSNDRVFCSRPCRQIFRVANSKPQITSSGYVKLLVGKGAPGADSHGHILEHRKVMQEFLGRPLGPAENVHHKNGDKTENRLANLELWTKSQPCGQRVADKLAWAREFIAQYEDTPMF